MYCNLFKDLEILTVCGEYILDSISSSDETFLQQSGIDTQIHSYNARCRAEIIPTLHNLQFFIEKVTWWKTPKTYPDGHKTFFNLFKRKLKEYLVD